MATTYEKARLEFFNLKKDQSIVITGNKKQLTKFRDSIYKLSGRYREYGRMFKTKLLTDKKLQIWRIK